MGDEETHSVCGQRPYTLISFSFFLLCFLLPSRALHPHFSLISKKRNKILKLFWQLQKQEIHITVVWLYQPLLTLVA